MHSENRRVPTTQDKYHYMCSSRASTATGVEGETPRAGAAEAPRRVPEYKVRRNAQGGAGSGAIRSKAQVSCACGRGGPGSSRPILPLAPQPQIAL